MTKRYSEIAVNAIKKHANPLAANLEAKFGRPSDQKEQLIDSILNSFQDPENWPTSDTSRIDLLKKWYRMAKNIRTTEESLKG